MDLFTDFVARLGTISVHFAQTIVADVDGDHYADFTLL